MNDKCLQLIDSYKKLIEYKNVFDFSFEKLDKGDVKDLKKRSIEIKNILKEIKEIFYQRNLGDLFSVVNTTQGKYHSMCVALISKYQKHNNDKDYDDVMENNIHEAAGLYPESLAFIGKIKVELGDMSGLQDLEDAKRNVWASPKEGWRKNGITKDSYKLSKEVVNVYKNFIDVALDFPFTVEEFLMEDVLIDVVLYEIEKLIDNKRIDDCANLIIAINNKHSKLNTSIYFKKTLFYFYKKILLDFGDETLDVYIKLLEKYKIGIDRFDAIEITANVIFNRIKNERIAVNPKDHYFAGIKNELDTLKNKFRKAKTFSAIARCEFDCEDENYRSTIKKAISLASGLKKEEKSDGLINVLSNQLYINDFKQSKKIINIIPEQYRKVEALCMSAKRKLDFKFDLKDYSWTKDIKEAVKITEELISQKGGCNGIELNKANYSIFKFYLEISDFKKAEEFLYNIWENNDSDELRGQATLEYIDAKIKSFE